MSLPSRLPAILQAVMQGQPQALADSHYPQWHLAPVNGLLNDPNGFCQVAGRYHLFYQWNPLACDHTYKCWGHWSSADLLHWRHEPIALMPDEEYDRNGCYSGSAVEFEGALTLCYTGNVKFPDGGRTAWQCLATENADGTFRKLGPVLPLPEGYTGHVRDPKVWRQDGRWYMVLGAQDVKQRGKVLLFTASDLREWRLVGEIAGHDVNGLANAGYMWECPDLFNVNGRSVFVFSPMELIEDTDGYADRAICMLPEFDEKTCTMKFPENWQLLDCGGDLYAPQTMTDADGNRISIAWLRMPEPVDGIWQGMFCLPRVVDVQNDHIYFRVLPAIRDGFCKKTDSLVSACGECAMIRAELKEGESLEIGGYKIWRQSGKVCADRTDVYPSGAKGWLHAETPQLKEGDLLEIFVDPNMIEIYANNGEYVLSQAVYGLGETFSYEMEKKPEIYLWNE